MTVDPTRLLEDPTAAAGLRADLGLAKGATAAGLDTAGGLASLKASMLAQTAATTTTTAAAAGGSAALKALLGLLVVGAGVAVWTATQNPASDTATLTVQPPPIGTPAAERPEPLPEPPAMPAIAPAPKIDAEPEPEEPEAIVPEPAPKHARASKKLPRDPAIELQREAKLVADARHALAANPSRALALTKQARREFPRGHLVEERDALAIRALAKLGKADAARRRAESFLAKHGRGPHADAVRRAVGL